MHAVVVLSIMNCSCNLVLFEFLYRGFLVAESDKDLPVLHQLRLHFSGFIAQMVGSMPQGRARSNLLTAMMRQELFFLFSGWCGVFALSLSGLEKRFVLFFFHSFCSILNLVCRATRVIDH